MLHFGRFDSAGVGGLERHVWLLLAGLADRVEIDDLVAADAHGGPAREERDGYRIYRAPSFGLLASAAISPQLLLEARSLELDRHYDVIHLHFPDPLSHAAAYLFPAATKVVVSWHSDIVRQERLLHLYMPFLNRFLARRVDAVIAATPAHFSSSQQLAACPREKLHVVPYGIDYRGFEVTDALRAGISRIRARHGAGPLIFTVGRHVYYKGLDYLIEAMKAVNGLLLLGGTGPLTERLREKAASLGVAGRVFFLGRIPDEELAFYYHAAEVFCLPSVERSEQFGLVQLEAMACGRPVVSCELHNGVTYVNQHGVTGIVVPPRDPQALASAINTLLNDSELRARMGDAGYRRATSEFSLERMIQGTLHVYEHVTGLAAGTLSRLGPRAA